MASNEYDPAEFGGLMQAVKGIADGFKELRDAFGKHSDKIDNRIESLRASIGTRCTDCQPVMGLKDMRDRFAAVDTRAEKQEDRLRFLEIKVAGIAVISGVASAYLTHLLTR